MCKVKKQYPKLIAIFTKSFPEFTIYHSHQTAKLPESAISRAKTFGFIDISAN